MILRYMLVVILLPLLAAAQGYPWLAALPSYSCRIPFDESRGGFGYHVTRYATTNITMYGLLATTLPALNGYLYGEAISYMFSDGEVVTRGDDMAAGAWGWNTGAVFSGTVTVNTNTFRTAGAMPVGYAVVGSTTGNVATVTVGGSTLYLTNSFDRTIRGLTNSTTISMCTTGWANIGITQMASQQWFSACVMFTNNFGVITEAWSISTNAAFVSHSWTCTPTTNYVVSRLSKYGSVFVATNIHRLSEQGFIPTASQLRIPNVAMYNPTNIFRQFGWTALYGPPPSDLFLTGREIDARAEYTKQGYGQ